MSERWLKINYQRNYIGGSLSQHCIEQTSFASLYDDVYSAPRYPKWNFKVLRSDNNKKDKNKKEQQSIETQRDYSELQKQVEKEDWEKRRLNALNDNENVAASETSLTPTHIKSSVILNSSSNNGRQIDEDSEQLSKGKLPLMTYLKQQASCIPGVSGNNNDNVVIRHPNLAPYGRYPPTKAKNIISNLPRPTKLQTDPEMHNMCADSEKVIVSMIHSISTPGTASKSFANCNEDILAKCNVSAFDRLNSSSDTSTFNSSPSLHFCLNSDASGIMGTASGIIKKAKMKTNIEQLQLQSLQQLDTKKEASTLSQSPFTIISKADWDPNMVIGINKTKAMFTDSANAELSVPNGESPGWKFWSDRADSLIEPASASLTTLSLYNNNNNNNNNSSSTSIEIIGSTFKPIRPFRKRVRDNKVYVSCIFPRTLTRRTYYLNSNFTEADLLDRFCRPVYSDSKMISTVVTIGCMASLLQPLRAAGNDIKRYLAAPAVPDYYEMSLFKAKGARDECTDGVNGSKLVRLARELRGSSLNEVVLTPSYSTINRLRDRIASELLQKHSKKIYQEQGLNSRSLPNIQPLLYNARRTIEEQQREVGTESDENNNSIEATSPPSDNLTKASEIVERAIKKIVEVNDKVKQSIKNISNFTIDYAI